MKLEYDSILKELINKDQIGIKVDPEAERIDNILREVVETIKSAKVLTVNEKKEFTTLAQQIIDTGVLTPGLRIRARQIIALAKSKPTGLFKHRNFKAGVQKDSGFVYYAGRLYDKDYVDLGKGKFNMQQFRSAVIDAGKVYRVDPNFLWTQIPKITGKSHAKWIADYEIKDIIQMIRSTAEVLKKGKDSGFVYDVDSKKLIDIDQQRHKCAVCKSEEGELVLMKETKTGMAEAGFKCRKCGIITKVG